MIFVILQKERIAKILLENAEDKVVHCFYSCLYI